MSEAIGTGSYGWQREKAADLATEFMSDINEYNRWQEDKDFLEERVFKALGEAEERGRREENEGWQKIIEGFELNHFTHGILQKGRARLEEK